jgi:hypothetical protein
LLLEQLQLILFLHNLVYVVLIVQVLSQLLNNRFVLLNFRLLFLQFAANLYTNKLATFDSLIFLRCTWVQLLFPSFPFLHKNLVHLDCQFLQLALEFDMLIDEFGFAE